MMCPLYKVLRVYPHSEDFSEFVDTMEKVLVIEETDMVIEALIGDRRQSDGQGGRHRAVIGRDNV